MLRQSLRSVVIVLFSFSFPFFLHLQICLLTIYYKSIVHIIKRFAVTMAQGAFHSSLNNALPCSRTFRQQPIKYGRTGKENKYSLLKGPKPIKQF